jgi:hypothetical protein
MAVVSMMIVPMAFRRIPVIFLIGVGSHGENKYEKHDEPGPRKDAGEFVDNFEKIAEKQQENDDSERDHSRFDQTRNPTHSQKMPKGVFRVLP